MKNFRPSIHFAHKSTTMPVLSSLQPMAHKLFSFSTMPLFFISCFSALVLSFPFGRPGTYDFYAQSCPYLPVIVRFNVQLAIMNDTRMAASLLRLHFHDCFVNGCDASILLDDTGEFEGEKNASPNRNSLRGFEVIDIIKAEVETACPSTVSCVDILALAAREAVAQSGGPFWPVQLGRRDGLTANKTAANSQLPFPFEPLENIIAKFIAKGLDIKDVAVLSGAHTVGFAQCLNFKYRLYNYKGSGHPDPAFDPSALAKLQSICPNQDSSNTNLAPLDTRSRNRFDNGYYKNLMQNRGLLESDQALMGDSTTAALVKAYSLNPYLFFNDFAVSVAKMGNIGVLTGQDGEIRKVCRSVNN